MKKKLSLMIVLTLISCKEATKFHSNTKNRKHHDSVLVQEVLPEKKDSIIKTSKPFKLNTILCYWENYIINENEINIILKNYKTKKILIEQNLYLDDFDLDYKTDDYFDKINNDLFTDLNFDGFKDFYFYSKGSMAMTSLTNIYLFNNKTKSFDYSEYLSDTTIEEIDIKNKKLVTFSFTRDYEVKKIHYFNKNGVVKYSEVYTTNYSAENDSSQVYEKIIKGKVVETKNIPQ